MRRISKGQEPPCLAEVRREVGRIETNAGSRLDDRWAYVKDCKPALQEALRRDQGGLCAYCGGRLAADMKIEHFVPRAEGPDSILVWSNLLGCCPGKYREGTSGSFIATAIARRTKSSISIRSPPSSTHGRCSSSTSQAVQRG
jgi:hypothetical protein